MRRHLVVLSAAVATAAVGLVPAHAATKPTPKPAPIKGGYSVTLLPDPTPEVTDVVDTLGLADFTGCSGVSPEGKNDHVLTIPAKGTLHVVLDSPDPTGTPGGLVGTDWDLYLIDTDGSVYDSSHGATSHEEVTTKFKKGQKITIEVCNLLGEPDGTVKYVFTYA